MDDYRLFTVGDVADRLQLGTTFVRQLIGSGQIASIRLGRQIRVRPADLREFMARGTAATAKPKHGASEAGRTQPAGPRNATTGVKRPSVVRAPIRRPKPRR